MEEMSIAMELLMSIELVAYTCLFMLAIYGLTAIGIVVWNELNDTMKEIKEEKKCRKRASA